MKSKVKSQGSGSLKERVTLFVVIILFFDLFFLYLSKYSRKNLSIMEFNPYSIGNILNFLSVVIPVLGLLILLYRSKVSGKRHYGILILTIFMNVPLILTIFFKQIKFPMPFEYLLGFPLERIYVGVFYATFQFILFFLGVLIWLMILGVERKIYLASFLFSILLVIILICWAFIYTNDDLDKTPVLIKGGKKSDVAVILGAAVWSKNRASPIFAYRISKACSLYNAGIVRKIQVTGGNAPGELTEAEVAYKLLSNNGVQAKDIWIEKKTSSTSEQVEFIKENLMREKNLNKIIIVSDRFHLKRVMEICDFFNVKADAVATDLKLSWEKSLLYRFRDSMALIVFWFFAL